MIEELKDVKMAEALFSVWQDSVVSGGCSGCDGEYLCGFPGKSEKRGGHAGRFLFPQRTTDGRNGKIHTEMVPG